jgi:hypothetical protein
MIEDLPGNVFGRSHNPPNFVGRHSLPEFGEGGQDILPILVRILLETGNYGTEHHQSEKRGRQ